MAGVTLAQWQSPARRLSAAEAKDLASQSTLIFDRELQRAMLKDVQAGIETCNAAIQKAQARGRTRYVVPQ